MKRAGPQILGTGAKFKRVPCQKNCRVNRALVSDTSRSPIRQGGREMSAPRPYETYPLHPPALFTSYAKFNFYINIKINANECYLYVILVLVLITAVIAVCFLLFVQSIVIICMARKLNKLRERYVLTPYCSCVERSRKWTLLIAFFLGGGVGRSGGTKSRSVPSYIAFNDADKTGPFIKSERFWCVGDTKVFFFLVEASPGDLVT